MSPHLICDYLYWKFKNNASTSSVNSIRSSINFFTLGLLDLENNIFMIRLFKYFYKERPLKPRYTTFWPVEKLLNFLKTWHPINDLSLKQVTLKTIALIALSSSDRGQTLHLANVKDMNVTPSKIEFVVRQKLKHTRNVLKPTIISCVKSNVEELDVSSYVAHYIELTKEFRGEEGALFLSWKTKKPVVKQSLARWLKLVLGMAGIDTANYKAHSYRGAGLSKAFQKGASLQQIVAAGNWKNASTFKNYYLAPSDESNIGNIILVN